MNEYQKDPIDQVKGTILKRLIEAGKACRKPFMETAREIARYAYSPNHDFQYQSMADANPTIKAKVAKTAQYLEVVGPLLYQQNPVRTVTPRPWVGQVARQRAELMQNLLDYIPKEVDLHSASRRAIQDACVSGAGFLWTEMDQDKGIPSSVHVPYKDVLLDPDARRWEDMGYVARRYLLPRYKLASQHAENPKALECIKKLPVFTETETNKDSPHEWETRDHGTDIVQVWRVWCKVGLQNYKGGVELIDAAAKKTDATLDKDQQDSMATIEDKSPMVYTVTEEGKLIDSWEWEVPYHLDGEFPCTKLSFRESPERIWPISPLEPGLPWQRALNYQWTLFLNRQRWAYRVILAFAEIPGSKLSEDVISTIMYGGDMAAFTFKSNNGDGSNINQLVQMMSFPTLAGENVQIVDQLERQFEQHTGLSDFILAGETARQMRSAEEARMREQKSMTRFEDMRGLVEKWASKAARKEAQMARFLMGPEDITRLFGPQAGEMWGVIMPPVSDQIVNAVMQLVEQSQGQLTPRQAQEAVMQDPGRYGIQEGVDYKQWLLECDYEIESGTGQIKNQDQKISALRELNNQTVSALLPNPNPQIQAHGLNIIADTMDAVGAPQASVAKLRESAAILAQTQPPPSPEEQAAQESAQAAQAPQPAQSDALTASVFMEGVSMIAQTMQQTEAKEEEEVTREELRQELAAFQAQMMATMGGGTQRHLHTDMRGEAIEGIVDRLAALIKPPEVYVTVPEQSPPQVTVQPAPVTVQAAAAQAPPTITVQVPEAPAPVVNVAANKSSTPAAGTKRKRRRIIARPMPDGSIEAEEED